MDIHRAIMMVTDCMNYHGLYLRNWQFKFTRSMSCLGAVHPKRRVLVLSKPYVQHNPEDLILDTILHEIAHALTYQEIIYRGSREYHGRIWQLKAIEIGAKPETCATAKDIVLPTKWIGTCKDCGAKVHRQRDPKPMTLLASFHVDCHRTHKPNKGRIEWLRQGKPAYSSTNVPLTPTR